MAPDYNPPHLILPDSYQGSAPFNVAMPNIATERQEWWTLFGDEQLNALEEQLKRSNPTLQAAAETYMQMRDLAAEAQSGLYPQIGAGGLVSDNRQSVHRLFRSGATGPNEAASNEITGSASWEPDFWDEITNRAREQKRLAQASAADLATAQLSLEAQLADAYIALRGFDAEVSVLRLSIAAYEKAVEVTRLRASGDIAPEMDFDRAESQLASAQAQEKDFELQREITLHAIAILVGAMPSTFSIAAIGGFHLAVPVIPPGIPSDLLQRRPDIASAERQMAAANAAIGVARAAFYPNIELSLTGGFQDTGFNLLSLPNSMWTVGATAMLPLFEGGLRRAELQRSWSAYAQMRDNYRAITLSAFQEVEDGLSSTAKLSDEVVAQHQASDQAVKALQASTMLYQGGLDNYLNVLVAQEQALAAQTTEVQIQTRQLQASVSLIRAVGGGWNDKILPSEEQTLPFGPLDYSVLNSVRHDDD